MEINYAIRIVDDDGDGVKGVKVSVHYDWTHDSDYSDSDGWVSFTKDTLAASGVRVKVYARGDLLGEPWVEDGDTLSYTL